MKTVTAPTVTAHARVSSRKAQTPRHRSSGSPIILVLVALVALVLLPAAVPQTLAQPLASLSTDVCDSFTVSPYCNNRGVCSPASPSPTCSCNAPFYGSRCEYGCSGRVSIVGASGSSVVTSGFISDGPAVYAAATTCQYDFSAPAGKTISLRVTQLSLECLWDYLYIFNGTTTRSSQVAALTGLLSDSVDFVLESNAATVLLYSDISLTFDGFNVSYWIGDCAFNCSDRGTCNNGVCACSQGFSGDYCQNADCPNGCRGNGVCSFGICTCFSGFTGADCSTVALRGGFSLQSSYSTSFSLTRDLPRTGHTATLSGSNMFVFGGYKRDFTVTNSFIRLRINDMNWDNVAVSGISVPPARFSHSAALYSNNIFIFGGISATFAYLSDLWKFDITINSWVQLSPATSLLPSSGHTATVVSRTMVILGGYNGVTSSYIQSVQEYDLDTNIVRIFKAKGVAPVRLFGHSAVSDGSDGIYVYGGYSPEAAQSASPSTNLYIYWVTDRTWSSLRAGPQGRFFHTALMIPNTPLMMVTGGNSVDGLTCFANTILLYDTSCNTWSTTTYGGNSLAQRHGHTSIVLNNGVQFIFGGYRGLVLAELVTFSLPVCANYTARDQCIAVPGCGWCSTSLRCIYAGSTNTCPVSFTRPETQTFCAADPCRQLHTCSSCLAAASSSSKCNWCSNFAFCFSTVQSIPPLCNAVSNSLSCASVPTTTAVSCLARYDCADCSFDDTCAWVSTSDLSIQTKCNTKTASSPPTCPTSCLQRSTCSDCLNTDPGVCLWCTSTRRCIPLKDYNGIQTYGQCQSWVIGTSFSCPADCESQRECSSCLNVGGCGWCSTGSQTGLGVCLRGTATADFNGTCSSSNWRYNTCPLCNCNGHSTCDTTGTCLACQDNTSGTRCEKCAVGYYGDPRNGGTCQFCAQQRGNATCYSCDSTNGACTNCSGNRSGSNCQDCIAGYYETFSTKVCAKCNCNGHSSGCDSVTGLCLKCDFGYDGADCGSCRSGFIGSAINGGTCLFSMAANTKYQFTADFRKLNLIYYPIEDGVDTSFSIRIIQTGVVTPDVFLDMWVQNKFDASNIQRFIVRNQRIGSFSMSLSETLYDMSSSVFYLTLTTNMNINFEVWFSQYPPPLNLLHFFLTFFACFFSLLMLSFVVWRVKMHLDRQRYVRELGVALQHMATRPSSGVILWDFCAEDGSRTVQTKTVPVAVEPMADSKSALMTFMVELPTNPSAPRQVCFGTALVATPGGDPVTSHKWEDEDGNADSVEAKEANRRHRLVSQVRSRLRNFRPQPRPHNGSAGAAGSRGPPAARSSGAPQPRPQSLQRLTHSASQASGESQALDASPSSAAMLPREQAS